MKNNSQTAKKAFFNYFDKRSQEVMLKISMEMQNNLFYNPGFNQALSRAEIAWQMCCDFTFKLSP